MTTTEILRMGNAVAKIRTGLLPNPNQIVTFRNTLLDAGADENIKV
jgi:hypothetical protein